MDAKIIIALDYTHVEDALNLVNQLNPNLCKLKVGKELFTVAGPQFIDQLTAKNFKVFLDLKFHDIPNTVGKACEAASNLGVWMLNVHASGGVAMMQAALEGVQKSAQSPYLIAVTVLTSMNQKDLTKIGIQTTIESQVINLALLAKTVGLDGAVCSALEAKQLSKKMAGDFLLVTPGIRPATSTYDDQARTMTPKDALNTGADYLVIGRPITQATKPLAALERIVASLEQ